MAMTEKERHQIKLDEIRSRFPHYIQDYVNYMEGRECSPSTLLGYLQDFEYFYHWLFSEGFVTCTLKELPESFLEKLKLDEVNMFLSHLRLRANFRVASRARKISSLKSIFSFLTTKSENAEGECYFYRNVMAKVTIPKSKKTTSKRADKISSQILQGDEDLKLIEFIEHEYMAKIDKKQKEYYIRDRERDLAILALFLASGVRASELTGLNIESLDIENRTISVIRKGDIDEEETVLFRSFACLYLSNYLEIRTTRYSPSKQEKALFVTVYKGEATRISVRSVQNIVGKYTEQFGKRMSPHKLRHTLATKMANENKPIVEIMLQLGHSSASTTSLYQNQTLDDRRRSLDELDGN